MNIDNLTHELLGEVLGREISEVEMYDFPTMRLAGRFDGFRHRFFINIYELQHKMKEYAFSKGYEIYSGVLSNDHKPRGHCEIRVCENELELNIKIINADTEFEAVVEALLWIKDK